jgi:LacI family transcriptional regulator
MATIKEIAALAGVSPTTVANVIHGRTRKMLPDTLRKVRGVLKQENYVSNMGGRLLAKHGSKIIGLIITNSRRDELNSVQDPFRSEAIGAIEHEIRQNGYFMMLYISADVDESLRMAVSWNVEGLIVLGSHADDCRKFVKNTEIPLVFVDSYFHEDGLPYVNVGLLDKKGGYMMTDYLIRQGHRNIAFLADSEHPEGVDFERFEGFRAALTAHKLPCKKENYIYFSYQAGERRRKMRKLIKNRLHNYTALFFASDYYAVDAMNLFYDEGLRVPEDISIAGFDGNVFAETCRPRLTTVRQDVTQKGACAVQQVLRLIRREKLEPRIIQLDVSLRTGGSIRSLIC